MGWCARGQKQVDFVATLMKDQMAPPFPVRCFSVLLGLQKMFIVLAKLKTI